MMGIFLKVIWPDGDLNLKISQKWFLFLFPTIYDHMKMPAKVEKVNFGQIGPPYSEGALWQCFSTMSSSELVSE